MLITNTLWAYVVCRGASEIVWKYFGASLFELDGMWSVGNYKERAYMYLRFMRQCIHYIHAHTWTLTFIYNCIQIYIGP